MFMWVYLSGGLKVPLGLCVCTGAQSVHGCPEFVCPCICIFKMSVCPRIYVPVCILILMGVSHVYEWIFLSAVLCISKMCVYEWSVCNLEKCLRVHLLLQGSVFTCHIPSALGSENEVVTLNPPFLDVNSCSLCTCQCTQERLPGGTGTDLGQWGSVVLSLWIVCGRWSHKVGRTRSGGMISGSAIPGCVVCTASLCGHC